MRHTSTILLKNLFLVYLEIGNEVSKCHVKREERLPAGLNSWLRGYFISPSLALQKKKLTPRTKTISFECQSFIISMSTLVITRWSISRALMPNESARYSILCESVFSLPSRLPTSSSRVRCIFKDLADLRKSGWSKLPAWKVSPIELQENCFSCS